ncbi:MAG: CPBP family intramembrane glutamic endopeptidase [bacterium]
MNYFLFFFLAIYNNVINLIPSDLHSKIYVWFNLLILIILFIITYKYLKLNLDDFGYGPKSTFRSLVLGLLFSSVTLLVFIFLLYLFPKLGINIKAPQIDIGSTNQLLYRLLIRIPLGTAFFEENLFRGMCYGYLIKKYSLRKTFIITSLLFALWHIVPALKVVSSNFRIGISLLALVMWFAGITGAFIAGIFFAVLRHSGRSIIGCIVSHALINDLALLVIYHLWK